MTKFLEDIFLPQLVFETNNDISQFVKIFSDLYRIDLFKDGLDLILTKVKEKNLKFEVKSEKGWDTNVGCFLVEKKSFYDKSIGKFFHQSTKKIILRSLALNVMAHEMAHALKFESGIDFGEEFRKAIGYDMKDREPSIITLKAEIKRLMIDALKSYPSSEILSELFARYFELLSISRDVCSVGSFATSDVTEFFINTTNFLRDIFNPQIRSKIDPQIAKQTIEIAKQVKISDSHTFREKIEFQGKRSGSFAKSIKSNAVWQKGWEKYKAIEDEKK